MNAQGYEGRLLTGPIALLAAMQGTIPRYTKLDELGRLDLRKPRAKNHQDLYDLGIKYYVRCM